MGLLLSEKSYDYWDETIIFACFRVSGIPKFWIDDRYSSFFNQILLQIVTTLVETLKEESKAVAMEKREFEYRHQSKITGHFGIFERSGCWCKDQMSYFLNWVLLNKWKLLIGTLILETKPAVMKKNESDYREKSLIKALFGYFGPSKLFHKDEIKLYIYPLLFYKFKVFDCDFKGRN